MNSADLRTAERLFSLARERNRARDLAATLRQVGLVRTCDTYTADNTKAREDALIMAWLSASGLSKGAKLGQLDRGSYLRLQRRAFALAEALNVFVQSQPEEEGS